MTAATLGAKAASRPPAIKVNGPFGEYVSMDRIEGVNLVALVMNDGAGYQIPTGGFLRLPHQVYLKELQELLADHPRRQLFIVPIRGSEIVDVTFLAQPGPEASE